MGRKHGRTAMAGKHGGSHSGVSMGIKAEAARRPEFTGAPKGGWTERRLCCAADCCALGLRRSSPTAGS